MHSWMSCIGCVIPYCSGLQTLWLSAKRFLSVHPQYMYFYLDSLLHQIAQDLFLTDLWVFSGIEIQTSMEFCSRAWLFSWWRIFSFYLVRVSFAGCDLCSLVASCRAWLCLLYKPWLPQAIGDCSGMSWAFPFPVQFHPSRAVPAPRSSADPLLEGVSSKSSSKPAPGLQAWFGMLDVGDNPGQPAWAPVPGKSLLPSCWLSRCSKQRRTECWSTSHFYKTCAWLGFQICC